MEAADGDVLIVLDECHRAKSLVQNEVRSTKTGIAVLALQNALPNARCVGSIIVACLYVVCCVVCCGVVFEPCMLLPCLESSALLSSADLFTCSHHHCCYSTHHTSHTHNYTNYNRVLYSSATGASEPSNMVSEGVSE